MSNVVFVIARAKDSVELDRASERDEAEEIGRNILNNHGWATVVYPKENSND